MTVLGIVGGMDRSFSIGRSRAAWWGFVAVLGVLVGWFVVSFIGTFIFGVFVYYGIRPLHDRLRARVARRGVTASMAILFVVLPVLIVLGYAGTVAIREFAAIAGPNVTSAVLSRLFSDPADVGAIPRSPMAFLGRVENFSQLRGFVVQGLDTLGAIGNAGLHLTLSLSFAFFLLRDGPHLSAWFREDIAGTGSVSEAYLRAVDADLEKVYFGNVLTVLLVGATAVGIYHGFNLLAPSGLRIPFPTLLALLTGLATFVPLVVGKLVYLPVSAYLGWRALQSGAGTGEFVFVGGFAVVAFLVLDLVPQTFVRPYLSGRSLHPGLVLFAYILGAALFGWYGLFVGPFIAVLVVQVANVILPELLHGDRLTSRGHLDIGSDPPAANGGPSDASESSSEDSDEA
jgi:predicted PurR-regulated permease PerM